MFLPTILFPNYSFYPILRVFSYDYASWIYFRLKNLVRGLEDDEVDFLDFVDNLKMKETRKIQSEDETALEEYR